MNARNFLITMNKASMDGYEKTLEYLRERGCNYYISCLEENSSEELHIHIYVQFPKQVRLSPVKCYKAHIDVCRGSEEQNVNYIKKMQEFGINNTLDEYGEIRKTSGVKQQTLTTVELRDMPFSSISWYQYRTWESLQKTRKVRKEELVKLDVKVYYVWGESGLGKTKYVYDHLPDGIEVDYVKHLNGFWHNVTEIDPPETCWYDEFRDSHMPASEFINFIDYYVHSLNVKGGKVRNVYKTIWITSVQDPAEIYKNWNDEDRKQWLRRMTIVNIENVENEN